MLKKLFLFSAWAIFLVLLLFIAVFIALWLDESLYFAIFLWFMQMAAVLLFRAAWSGMAQLWEKRKFRRFYAPLQFTRMEQVLFEHWRSGAAVIKRISRKWASVPWFILIGGRCGKTTLMSGARLPIMSHQSENETVVPTRTLRWWFFKHACFLDTSSYFLKGAPAAKGAWKKLANWCGHVTAPSGIVICVSVRDLQSRSLVELHQQARLIRIQLEPVMKSVRRKLPLHVVLTGCDEIAGFKLWAGGLRAEQRQQALGYGWQQSPVADRRDRSLLEPLFDTLKHGIETSRMSMLNGEIAGGDAKAQLTLVKNVELLHDPLHHFIAALCEPDAYFASGALAGIWLTASVERPQKQNIRDSWFIQNLINHVLPANSNGREVEAFGRSQQWLNRWAKPLMMAALTTLLMMSAWQTAPLLEPTTGTDAEVLAQRLEVNERWMSEPLRYFPFIPLLRQRHHQLELALANAASLPTNDIHLQLKSYRRAFHDAAPPLQRQMIIDLANSILLRQAMTDGAPLKSLLNLPGSPLTLRLLTAGTPLTPLAQLAVTRAQLRLGHHPTGILPMQQMLKALVSSDSNWRWLVADDGNIESLRISYFWPDSTSTESLSGAWLREGERALIRNISVIQQASGGRELEELFKQFWRQWPALKQDAWMNFLLTVSRQETLQPGQKASIDQLMSVVKARDPVSLFLRRAASELAEISDRDAQPWLNEVRRLNFFLREPKSFPTLQSVNDKEQALRIGLSHWLKNERPSSMVSVADLKSWQHWQQSLHQAVSYALASNSNSGELTAGLFSSDAKGKMNPLAPLYASYVQLRRQMAFEDHEINRGAVWALLEGQLNMLTSHAMANSACWLEQQWQSKVLQPLGNRPEQRDYQQQQQKAWRYISDFINGSVKEVMMSSEMGLRSGRFHGHEIPFKPEFLHVVNHVIEPDDILLMPDRSATAAHDVLSRLDEQLEVLNSRRQKMTKQDLNVRLVSLPATIPGGASLMPIGSKVELHCATRSWALDSDNLHEEATFRWAPDQCNAVSLSVKFPGSELKYHYLGESAWYDFLADFDSGERRYTLDEFSPEGSEELRDLQVKEVLVRYQLNGQQTVFRRWQEWQQLNDEIEELRSQREAELIRQRDRRQPRYFQGALSSLPTSVALCRN